MTCHWFWNKRILRFHLIKNFKGHSVRYWEQDWLFRLTIFFQLNNGKNIWSSLKMQWQLPHLTNDCTVWPWWRWEAFWAVSWEKRPSLSQGIGRGVPHGDISYRVKSGKTRHGVKSDRSNQALSLFFSFRFHHSNDCNTRKPYYYTSAQSDQSLRCPHEDSLGP